MPVLSRAVSARLLSASFLTLSVFIGSTANAADLGPYGKVTGDFRYRYENVDDAARDRNGVANTARMRLGYQTPEWNKLYGYGEVETIRHIGPTKFDDGLNGKTEFGRISDPQLNGINQLYIHYKHSDDVSLRVGRQPLQFDNQRFVSYSKSRQNDPVFDAALAKYGFTDDLNVSYAYSLGLNRFSGSRSTSGRFEGNLHLLNLHYNAPYDIQAAAYSYWLDFDGVPAEQNLSSRTHGLRLTWEPKGEGWHPIATAEFARQSDTGHSALSYDENYYLVDAGVRYDDIKVIASVEHLGGDGTSAMQTPVGGSHNLTGYADKFSTIPVTGLRDARINVIVPYQLPWEDQSLELIGQYHQFNSDDGDIDYGHETGVSLTYRPVNDHAINLKYASYKAEDFSGDTDKLLLSYEFKF